MDGSSILVGRAQVCGNIGKNRRRFLDELLVAPRVAPGEVHQDQLVHLGLAANRAVRVAVM